MLMDNPIISFTIHQFIIKLVKMNHKEQKFISETCTEKAWNTLEIKNRMNLSKKRVCIHKNSVSGWNIIKKLENADEEEYSYFVLYKTID